MKPALRKTALLLMLLTTAALLSACYKDVDPWPVSAPLATELPPTAAPTQEPGGTLIPRTTVTPVPEPTVVPQPIFTQQPADFWDVEPTEVPGGSVEPGVNG